MTYAEWWVVSAITAELQDAAVRRILFDDLYPLSGYFNPPIPFLCIWKELAECGEPLLRGLDKLAYQVFFEGHVILADGQ